MSAIVSKVEKLVALSASPHIEEARTSSYMACKLIRKHGLRIACNEQCDKHETTDPPPSEKNPSDSPGRFVPIRVKHQGFCIYCGEDIRVGERALWRKGDGLLHLHCKAAYQE
jgi:hypothetical protein